MLPEAEDAPARAAEGACNAGVAGAIGGNLGGPEGGVIFGLRAVLGATVPETAVDEDREFQGGENEIRFAENRLMTSPADNAVFSEDLDQAKFGVPISAPAYQRHYR